MKSPELMITGEVTEMLHEFNIHKYGIDEIAEMAILGLREHFENGSVKSLTVAQGALIEHVLYMVVEKRIELSVAVSSIISKVQDKMMTIVRTEKHGFPSEEVGRQFGRTRIGGVQAECVYFLDVLSEKDSPDEISRVFTSGYADSYYKIDAIKTYWRLAENGEDWEVHQIDLVQIKNDVRRISDKEIEEIVEKHKKFVREERFAIPEIKEIGPEETKVSLLINNLGKETADALSIASLEALTSNEAQGKESENFLNQLELFKKTILENKHFAKSSLATKKSFIESLGYRKESDIQEIFLKLDEVFKKWKEIWVNEIPVMTKRVPKPIFVPIINSVIYFGNQKAEVREIS